jgi:hypothetical protein
MYVFIFLIVPHIMMGCEVRAAENVGAEIDGVTIPGDGRTMSRTAR